MYRNLVSDYVERNESSVSVDGNLNLRTLRTLHQPYHTVLRHLDSGDILVIDPHNPVSLHETGLF